jgi:hypothetical protein
MGNVYKDAKFWEGYIIIPSKHRLVNGTTYTKRQHAISCGQNLSKTAIYFQLLHFLDIKFRSKCCCVMCPFGRSPLAFVWESLCERQKSKGNKERGKQKRIPLILDFVEPNWIDPMQLELDCIITN